MDGWTRLLWTFRKLASWIDQLNLESGEQIVSVVALQNS